ncbi:hypothetical protein EON65_05535 [archaeon]|nr:MAG: hypothetical protein EON65_05535 [archaeon]
MQLSDWAVVLNEVDKQLDLLIRMSQVQLLCCSCVSLDSPTEESSEPTLPLSVTIEKILILLKFTSALLKHSAGKEIYNSIEVSR